MSEMTWSALGAVGSILGAVATAVIAGLTLRQSRQNASLLKQNAAQIEEMKTARKSSVSPRVSAELGFRDQIPRLRMRSSSPDVPPTWDLIVGFDSPTEEQGVEVCFDITLFNTGLGPALDVGPVALGDVSVGTTGSIDLIEPGEYRQVRIEATIVESMLMAYNYLRVSYQNVYGDECMSTFRLYLSDLGRLEKVELARPYYDMVGEVRRF